MPGPETEAPGLFIFVVKSLCQKVVPMEEMEEMGAALS